MLKFRRDAEIAFEPRCFLSLRNREVVFWLAGGAAPSAFRGVLQLSGGGFDQSWQLDEIVGSHRDDEFEVELFPATQPGPRQATDGLTPAQPNDSSMSLRFYWLIS